MGFQKGGGFLGSILGPVTLAHVCAFLLTAAIAFKLGKWSASGEVARAAILQAPVVSSGANGMATLPVDLVTFQRKCNATGPAPGEVRQFLLDATFNGECPFSGFPPPEAAKHLRHKRVKGWGSDNNVFRRLMTETKPRLVLEIGTFLGASAINMAALAKELGLRTTILCIDDFRGWLGFSSGKAKFRDIKMINGQTMLLYQFMQNVLNAGYQDVVLPVPFSTSHALGSFCGWGIRADLIEVDAGHDFHSAWTDINAAFPLLSPGGVMFGHDYFYQADNYGVQRAVDLFAKLNGFVVEPDDQHWILRKG